MLFLPRSALVMTLPWHRRPVFSNNGVVCETKCKTSLMPCIAGEWSVGASLQAQVNIVGDFRGDFPRDQREEGHTEEESESIKLENSSSMSNHWFMA